MALPLYLAMTASEMSSAGQLPRHLAWMACHFSAGTLGLSNIPQGLPEGAILILDDRYPCQGHSADLAAGQLAEAAAQLGCSMVLLDFQRPPEPESLAMSRSLLGALPCPAAVTPDYARESDCVVFLPPCPLSCPLEEHLAPWKGREIWIEAVLCQEEISITEAGAACSSCFPPDGLEGGFYAPELCCKYKAETFPDQVRFTLFDTPETLKEKIKKAQALGISGAIGLYQQLQELS